MLVLNTPFRNSHNFSWVLSLFVGCRSQICPLISMRVLLINIFLDFYTGLHKSYGIYFVAKFWNVMHLNKIE